MMSASAAKHAVASAIGRWWNLDQRIGHPGRRYVMAYHRVISPRVAAEDHAHDAMWISPETFLSHIHWMRSVGDIVDHETILEEPAPGARARFALTFDDGWRDNHDVAFPLLRDERVPATVFLVSDAITRDRLFWPEDVVTKTHRIVQSGGAAAARVVETALDREWPAGVPQPRTVPPARRAEAWVEVLKRIDAADRTARIANYFGHIGAGREPLTGYLMSWDQAREMQRGGVRFGSHTHTHQILEGLDQGAAEYELRESRTVIARELGTEVTAFCYPNARYAGNEAPLIARVGYRTAFRIDGRQVRTPINPFYVPRFLVSEHALRNMDFFRLRLLEAGPFAARPHRRLPVPAGSA